MYVLPNFKTKKQLKEAVALGKEVRILQPGYQRPLVGRETVSVEGPHYPEQHRWYARVVIEDGVVKEVRG